jgi:HAD superfamily hydrolase (TIGR01549 family)
VIFDLGKTLWFEARPPARDEIWRLEADALRPLVARWGLPIDGQLESIVESIWVAYETAWEIETERVTHRDPDLPFLIKGALASRDLTISDEQADAWWRRSWIPVRYFGYQLYPDALDVLRELRDLGIRIAVNSNRACTADMLWPDLEDFGLAPYVDVAVCSGDTGYVKPHPSTFELALRQIDVPAAHTLVVGDTCERDCAGAKALGMRTVLKLNGRYDAPPCNAADYSIHDLAELLALPVLDRRRRPLVTTESLTPHEDANADRY